MGISVRLPALALAASAHRASANFLTGWLERQEAVLAAPTVAARIAEELPLVMMVSWAVILFGFIRAVRKTFRMLVLPGVQVCELQLMFFIVCNAIAPTFGRLKSHHHYNWQFGMLEYVFQGLPMLLACVVLPRRVVSYYVTHTDLHRHYKSKLQNQKGQVKTRKFNFNLVPGTDSEETESTEHMARSVKSRSRQALWYSRTAAIILLVTRPILSTLLLELHWWTTHAVLDVVLLAVGTAMAWAAGNELTKELLHDALPKYREMAFLVNAMVWAFLLQHISCVCLGVGLMELPMMSVVHVGEVAFVTNMAAGLVDPDRDPLVTLAFARRGAREAADDESTASSAQPPRFSCLQLCRAVFNVTRLARDICVVSLPWPLTTVKEDASKTDSDASESEETTDTTKLPAEVQVGRDAWDAWAARTGIHPAWQGKRPNSRDQEVLLSPEERAALLTGKTGASHNTWWLVPADLFTDRVRSKLLAVVMVVILVVMVYSHDIFNQIVGQISNPVAALGVQLCLIFALWLLFGLLVFGNNAFLGEACQRRWIFFIGAVCLGLAIYTSRVFFDRQEAFRGGGAVRIVDVFDDVQRRWADFSVGMLSFLGFFLAVHLYVEKPNDYHTCEFNALWYTSDILQSTGSAHDFRRHPPQRGEALLYSTRTTEGEVKALVSKDHGDGTCDVVLADGRCLARERHKFFKRFTGDGAAEESTLDTELQRLKALRPASRDYPAVLYLGAISALPLLTAIACAILLAVRTVLHVVWRLHVYAGILTFALHATVVPPGESPAASASLARNVLAWRLDGGTGLLDEAHLPQVANISGLHYRWSGDNESYPCTDLPQGNKIIVLSAMGLPKHRLSLRDAKMSIAHTLEVIWGLEDHAAVRVERIIEHIWSAISANEPDFKLDSAKVGTLLCEAKLLSTVRLKTAGGAAFMAVQGLAVSFARNFTESLEDTLETASWANWPVVSNVRDMAVQWIKKLQTALTHFQEGGTVASGKVVEKLESGLEHSAPFLKAAGHLARGGSPDAETIVDMLDKDGNGKLSLADEAPALVDLGVKLCSKAGCGHMVESKVWEALSYADQDGDGELSVDDVKNVVSALKESFGKGKKVLAGVCGTGGTIGVLAGAVGTVGVVANSERAPGWQELLGAFDSNGDSALTLQEVMGPMNTLAADTTGCMGSSKLMGQAEQLMGSAGLGKVLEGFRKADVNKDGRLTLDEAVLGGFAQAVAKLCPERSGTDGAAADDGAAGTTVVASRRLADEVPAEGAMDAEIVVNPFNTAALGQTFGVLDDIMNILSQDFIPWILIAINWVLYLSVFCASICQLYVVGRCFSKYTSLFESMQSGHHDYVGHTSRESLERGFAETTLFPGMLFGTTFFGFLFVSVLVFIVLVVTIVICLPFWGAIWQQVYPVLLYLVLAYCLKEFISVVVMDVLLCEEGEIIYPALFSLFWFIQLFLNFVLGVSTALCRSVVVLLWAVLCCCFVDFTLMDEQYVSMDSGYYSLLTMVYTHHVRRNPIKKAMTTTLFRHIQGLYGEEKDDDDGEQPTKRSNGRASVSKPRLYRARARFLLALTLHRNPELRRYRMHPDGEEAEPGGSAPEQE